MCCSPSRVRASASSSRRRTNACRVRSAARASSASSSAAAVCAHACPAAGERDSASEREARTELQQHAAVSSLRSSRRRFRRRHALLAVRHQARHVRLQARVLALRLGQLHPQRLALARLPRRLRSQRAQRGGVLPALRLHGRVRSLQSRRPLDLQLSRLAQLSLQRRVLSPQRGHVRVQLRDGVGHLLGLGHGDGGGGGSPRDASRGLVEHAPYGCACCLPTLAARRLREQARRQKHLGDKAEKCDTRAVRTVRIDGSLDRIRRGGDSGRHYTASRLITEWPANIVQFS